MENAPTVTDRACTMTNLTNAWKECAINGFKPIEVKIRTKVRGIYSYLADYSSFTTWRQNLGENWKPGMVLPCFDIRLECDTGQQIVVQLDPGLSSIRKGQLLEGDWILLTRLSRSIGSLGRGSYFILHSWISCPAPSHLPSTKDSSRLRISDYSIGHPLGHPGTQELCPWTFLFHFWPKSSLTCLQVLPKQMDYKRLRVLSELNPNGSFNNQSLPTLITRILATSRTRLITQQNNKAKPYMTLKNLLVADRSAYTVITLWDEAVVSSHGRFSEGDILLLEGRYKLNRHQDPVKQRLAPKLRVLGVSPTEYEIKLNLSDLDRVHLIHSGAVVPYLPPSLWNFITVADLVEGKVFVEDKLVDFIGRVLYHGRWERQACSRPEDWSVPDSPHHFTGQFWVRLWLELVDYSTSSKVAVKVYVDRDNWHHVTSAIPGNPVVLTNLLYKLTKDGSFSHLETSTESQMFSVAAAEDSRFAENSVVAAFRETSEEKIKLLDDRIRNEGSFGGYAHLQMYDHTHLKVVETKDDLINFMDNLAWRESLRVTVIARLDSLDSTDSSVINSSVQYGSIPKRVGDVDKSQLNCEVEKYCHLGPSLRVEGSLCEDRANLFVLEIDDLKLCVLNKVVSLTKIEEFSGRLSLVSLDLFRLEPSQEIGKGVEAVVTDLNPLPKRKLDSDDETDANKRIELDDIDDDNDDSNWSVHTQDLIDMLT